MICLFLGGGADGLHREVPDGVNFVTVKGRRTGKPFSQQYRRRVLDTRNGPVSVFTHDVVCPIERLMAHYEPELGEML